MTRRDNMSLFVSKHFSNLETPQDRFAMVQRNHLFNVIDQNSKLESFVFKKMLSISAIKGSGIGTLRFS
jgi:hypothetical protein